MFKAIGKIVCLCLVALASMQLLHAEDSLSMAVLSYRPQEITNQQWLPLADYLSDKLDRKVKVTAYKFSELEEAVQSNKPDIVLTNPAHYILLRIRNGLSAPLVTQVTNGDGHALTAFGGVIFTRSDNTGISNLNDISNKTVAITKVESFGGYLMQAFELLDHGMKAIEASKLLLTGMPHDNVVNQVLQGHADVGFVRTGVLEFMVKEGKISPDSYKIINPQDLPEFPYMTSTRLYPEWPLAVMHTVNEELSRELTLALLSIQADDYVATILDHFRFTIPANYSGVENLLRALKEAPYNVPPRITAHDLWQRYAEWIVAILTLFTLLVITSIRLLYKNVTIKKSNKDLKVSYRVFNSSLEGIIITNAQKEIIDINPAFSDITGYSREDIIGKNHAVLSSSRQGPEFYQAMWQEVNEQGSWQGEIWNRTKEGELYAELLSISALKNEQGEVSNYVGIFSDITSSKQQQEKLSQMAHYDMLTGLPNRTLFADRFTQSLAHSKRSKSLLAVCFLDLDNFKPVNDNYGHDAGDQLLIEVAQRITANIREEDTASRQGGDEFALLLNDIESYGQCEITIERILNALAKPYIIDDSSHIITASIGVTLYPDDKADIDTLLRHADNAMYQAKQSGKHRYHIFDSQHDKQLIQKHHKLDEIQQALINNEFQLYYQPKVNTVTGKVFGAEALIRWHHPEKGLIPPLDFLPLIDGTNLELKIGDWVINQALQQMECWLAKGIKLEVSVNIASRHLQSGAFFANLEQLLSHYPAVKATDLQLEILESSALSDLDAISQIIRICQQALGVNIALDDFGTGYSSLTHLRHLTANTIKIDQSFVRDMLDDPSDYTIIDGVIGLAESFGREVIAEGVETTEHGLMLQIMGCKAAQGYGIAKPMPADEFRPWLSDYQPNQRWLDCGKQVRSDKENKLKLFRLISRHWLAFFVSNIQSTPEDIKHWPTMGGKHDPCSQWIKRKRKVQQFTSESLNRLDKAHDHFHTIAQSIHHQYQQGDIDGARAALPALQSAFDEMSNAVGLLE